MRLTTKQAAYKRALIDELQHFLDAMTPPDAGTEMHEIGKRLGLSRSEIVMVHDGLLAELERRSQRGWEQDMKPLDDLSWRE